MSLRPKKAPTPDGKESHTRSSSSTPTGTPLQPTPPPGAKPDARFRKRRPSSRTSSRASSVASRESLPDPNVLSRQNSLIASSTNEICYDYLPDVTKPATTIGRYHTIVPPIARDYTHDRPLSREPSAAVETGLYIRGGHTSDDHAIYSVSEENDPLTPRLKNPTANSSVDQSSTSDDIFVLPPQEPEPSDKEPRVRLAIKLPDGSRIDRYFSPTNRLQAIVDFASMSMQKSLAGYSLRSPEELFKQLNVRINETGLKDRTVLHLSPPL